MEDAILYTYFKWDSIEAFIILKSLMRPVEPQSIIKAILRPDIA